MVAGRAYGSPVKKLGAVGLLALAMAGCSTDVGPTTSEVTATTTTEEGATVEMEEPGVDTTTARSGSIDVEIPAEGLTLAATFELPPQANGTGLVFIHGSGPNGRDETLPGQLNMVFPRPIAVFEEIAETLRDGGIASLRYDKRTCGPFNGCADNGYPPPAADVSVDDFIGDAEAAALWLLDQPEVDRVFVLGHSQGGTFVPILLDRQPDLAGGILLAAPYFSIERQLQDQADFSREFAAQAGLDEATIETAVGPLDELAAAVAAIKSGTYSGPGPQGTPTAFWSTWIDRSQEAAALVPAIARPLLIVSGDYDWNVPTSETEAWRSATDQAAHRVVVLPCLTHAFNCVSQPDPLQITPADIGRNVDGALFDELVGFLR